MRFLILYMLFLTPLKYISQNINIPDPTFKLFLTSQVGGASSDFVAKNLSGNYTDVDLNQDGEIQISEAQQISYLMVYGQYTPFSSKIASLKGIEYFINLDTLLCHQHKIDSLDISPLVNLKRLLCDGNGMKYLKTSGAANLLVLSASFNQLSVLDLSQNDSLQHVDCNSNILTILNVDSLINLGNLQFNDNQIQTINLKGLFKLNTLYCKNNQLQVLDANDCYELQFSDFRFNPLEYLFVKNGIDESLNFNINGILNLKFICVDEMQIQTIRQILTSLGIINTCEVNTYCNFEIGGSHNNIKGSNTLDLNSNGCDVLDTKLESLKLSINDGANLGYTFSNNVGAYNFYTSTGTFTISPILDNPNYFNFTSLYPSVTFTDSNNNIEINDFCFQPNGVFNDLEIVIIPITAARPGFSSEYKIKMINKGNTTLTGNIELLFNDSITDFISSSNPPLYQSQDTLIWSYINLIPFESREFSFSLYINSPSETPSVNPGDVLIFHGSISPFNLDETPMDNYFDLIQTTVGSYDPNDKICLNGATVSENIAQNYLYYIIHFENTGTYYAESIVVKDSINSAMLNLASIQIVESSHPCYANMKNGYVEFIFENINLPFADSINDGYVVFKIKPNSLVSAGDIIKNKAYIYFDYNLPIITNESEVLITSPNSVNELTENIQLLITPNPSQKIIHVESEIVFESVDFFDCTGRSIKGLPIINNSINIECLPKGLYFMKLVTKNLVVYRKIIKE